MSYYKAIPVALSKQLYQTLWADVGPVTLPDWLMNGPATPQTITKEERLQGLAAIWAEARVSFAYWDRLGDLDWDAAFRQYLPRVEAAEDPGEYYSLLREFVQLLDEGHSYVAPPPWLQAEKVPPPVGIRCVEGEPVVLRGDLLPPGTVITAVDGRPAAECVAEATQQVFASTDHDRMNKACSRILLGARESTALVGVRRPDGTAETVPLRRTGPLPGRPAFEHRDLGEGRVLVRINTWADPTVVDQFNEAFPDFSGVRALIIDQRYNGGGNSQYGEQIFSRLIDQPFEFEVDASPLYWGAMRFAGLSHLLLVTPEQPLQPDTARPRFAGPLAVLTSSSTFSAAETFCMMVRSSGRGTIVGETTGGSTGNPAVFQLPGGGVGAVSAMKVTFPDGTPLIGVGVVPDIPVAPTIAGLGAGKDEVLERALALLDSAAT